MLAAIQLLHTVPGAKVFSGIKASQMSFRPRQTQELSVTRTLSSLQPITLLGTTLSCIPHLSSLPTAGRLPHCISNWEQITGDPWVLQSVMGCRLDLSSIPSQKFPPIFSSSRFQADTAAIQEEVSKLLGKEAIQVVPPRDGQFLSRIFTVPKKDGSVRPVVNLKSLNQFLVKQRFKMEGIASVKNILQRGDWMISIDLLDAYLSVVMAEEHRKFLRFQWGSSLYEFQCLPFGLSSAPRIFTKLLKPVMAMIRQRGIRAVIFLDDMLVMAQSKESLRQQTAEIVQLLELLGFVVNLEKSCLEPTQSILYLGFTIVSSTMTISLPQVKVSQVQQDCQWALQQQTVSIRDLCHLIGRLTASIQAVLPAPLCYRNLQRIKNQAFAQSQDFDAWVSLDQSAKEELCWWVNNLQAWNGKAVLSPVPDLVMETDASLLGWGAVLGGMSTSGLWSETERSQHINSLELMAGVFAVKTFASQKRNVHIHLRMDNRTAIFYINRMGGTRSHALAHSACQLWQWCLQRGITLSAEHLPGSDNSRADKESRLLQSSAEWRLHRGVFRQIMSALGPCQVDLFATRLNCQLQRYVSWRSDPFAIATNAFTLNWQDMEGYAFPPFALIGKCLQKVREERATLLLIAPTWSTQP